jgi:hypothetical protein
MLLLPKANRDTVELLFVFFDWFAKFGYVDDETKQFIGLKELALLFASVFFGLPTGGVSSAILISGATPSSTLQFLLENQDTLLRVPSELAGMLEDLEYFEQSADAPSKEILKRCDSYMKMRGPTESLFSLMPDMITNITLNNSASDNSSETAVEDVDSVLLKMSLSK